MKILCAISSPPLMKIVMVLLALKKHNNMKKPSVISSLLPKNLNSRYLTKNCSGKWIQTGQGTCAETN